MATSGTSARSPGDRPWRLADLLRQQGGGDGLTRALAHSPGTRGAMPYRSDRGRQRNPPEFTHLTLAGGVLQWGFGIPGGSAGCVTTPPSAAADQRFMHPVRPAPSTFAPESHQRLHPTAQLPACFRGRIRPRTRTVVPAAGARRRHARCPSRTLCVHNPQRWVEEGLAKQSHPDFGERLRTFLV